jgi:hypothetical protein
MTIPAHPQRYTHTHPKSHTNDILMRYDSISTQEAAYRVFLDCFCYHCGYRAWYQTEDYKSGTTLHTLDANCEGKNKKKYTEEEKKVYTRYGAVMKALSSIPRMHKKDCLYLVGELSGHSKLNKAHHSLHIRPMAIQLERLSKTMTPPRRKAVLKAWEWVTGYDSYEDAYDNVQENRVLTDEGIKGQYSLFNVPDDLDKLDEEQITRFMQNVSVYPSHF